MKNVILTHKELQANMFVAFADAMCNTYRTPPGYFLTWSHSNTSFAFELWQSATEASDGKRILIYDEMSKGDSEVNDVRLGVMAPYFRDHSSKFLKQVEEWFSKNIGPFPVVPLPDNPLSRPANYDLETLFRELKFGRPAASQKYLDKCIEGLGNKAKP